MEISLEYNRNKNKCKIYFEDILLFEKMREHFSVPNNATKFVKGNFKRYLPSRIYYITNGGEFNVGLVEDVLKWFKILNDIVISFKFCEEFKKRFNIKKDIGEIYDNLKFNMYEYQMEACKIALKRKGGIFKMATGAGKTFTISNILNNLFLKGDIKRALIIVPDIGLVKQFYDDMVNLYGMNYKITTFNGENSILDEESQIIISNRQMFLSRYAVHEKFFRNEIDCLVIDECHQIKRTNEITKKIEKLKASYIYGFSGTLPEEEEDKMKLLAIVGPIRYEISSKELRDSGFLSNVKLNVVELGYINENFRPSGNKFSDESLPQDMYIEEMEWVMNNTTRNEFICNMAKTTQNNALLLVNRIFHGVILEEILNSMMEESGIESKKEIFFVQGSVGIDTREEIKKIMEEKNNVICIAMSKIFSTGINIKNIHNIFLLASSKSSIQTIQSIGRGLRLHPDKKILSIYDITDNLKYSKRHLEKRLSIYSEERIPVTRKAILI